MRGALQAGSTRLQITIRGLPVLPRLRLLVERRRQARRQELEVIERLSRELRRPGSPGIQTPEAFVHRHWH
jgi:hypothetical protein